MNDNLKNLQPDIVWSQFAKLCEIPRSSQHEAALIQHLIGWAQTRGITTFVDAAGNLILNKLGSPGYEGRPTVVLQGHLDMVCQANTGTQHNFERDPIRTLVSEGWVVAQDTTLGADNGIGVALALAALEATDLIHPPLEVLLTVNEESGMSGARGLMPGTLQGSKLINLDTEEWGHFYLGCAGGVDVEVRHGCLLEEVPHHYELVQLEVGGLQGGHSGIDIHLKRGNAIKLLAEALRDLSSRTDMRLLAMRGGSARNAIPREAYAVCAIPDMMATNIEEWRRQLLAAWQARFAQQDSNVSLVCKHHDKLMEKPIARAEQEHLLAFLDSVVNGVTHLSEEFPGVTDTSSNLGVVVLERGVFKATFKARSLSDIRADTLADKLVSCAGSYTLNAWKSGAYPGWAPDVSSNLLALCQRVYAEQFGQSANLQVIHAGLECGLLAASHPNLEMISFGPDIRSAHAPGERVEIESVARCWKLLKAVLRALAQDTEN